MTELVKLNDVADIKLGLPFKKAISNAGTEGVCYLIQTKDVVFDENIRFEELLRVIPETNYNRHVIEKEDILLRMKGPVFSAAIVDRNKELPIITTNQVVVIRCDKQKIDPYYLRWFLNSRHGQSLLNQLSEGSNIIKISLKSFANIELRLPTTDQQLKIGSIHKNWLEQKSIYNQLVELNNLYFNELCNKLHMEELNEH